jgi:hypothetical protein
MAKELKELRTLINIVCSDPRLEDGQRDQLKKWGHELEGFGRCGKVRRRDVVRVISRIAAILQEVLKR